MMESSPAEKELRPMMRGSVNDFAWDTERGRICGLEEALMACRWDAVMQRCSWEGTLAIVRSAWTSKIYRTRKEVLVVGVGFSFTSRKCVGGKSKAVGAYKYVT